MAREPVLPQDTSVDLGEVLTLLQRSDLKPDDRFNSIAFRFNRLTEESKEEIATLLPTEVFSRRPEFLRHLPPERRAREILEVVHSGPKAEVRTALARALCHVLSLLPPGAAQVVWAAAFPDAQFDERGTSYAAEKRILASLGNRLSISITPEAQKRGAQRIADVIQHSPRADHRALICLVPRRYRLEHPIFVLLSPVDQAFAAASAEGGGLVESTGWMSEASKVLTAFRLAQLGQQPPEDLDLPMEEKLARAAFVLLWAKDRPTQRKRAFAKAHTLVQDYVTEQAWTSTEALDLSPLLPRCPVEVVAYCEARAWTMDEAEKRGQVQISRAYCPRLNLSCTPLSLEADGGLGLDRSAEVTAAQFAPTRRPDNSAVRKQISPYGARLYAMPNRPWQDWSLLDLLVATGVEPDLPEIRGVDRPLPSASVYVLRLSGWVNRLNEIRERLRCSRCGAIMTPNYTYARNLAAYNSTVASCPHGSDHDYDVYLSHCWACGNIIDSREAGVRVDGFYLCRLCGSGPQHSNSFHRGDQCPNCGMPGMAGTESLKTCLACRHQVQDPKHALTLDRRRKFRDADLDSRDNRDGDFNWGS